jgi:integrase
MKKLPMPTMREIQALPPGRLYLGHGLLLKITPTSRTWMYRYTKPSTGKPTETSIGPWPEYGYSSARQVATQLHVMVLQKKDPVDEARKLEGSKTTFEQACDAWIETRESSWSKGQMRNAELLLKKHGKPLATKSVACIDSDMVEDAIRPLWFKAPKQARRALSMWARVFNYAKHKKFCTGDNPAVWDGNLSHEFPESKDTNRKHHPAMPYQQVPKFIRELRPHQNRSTTAVALEFCILNASRPGEVRGMQWSEIDWDQKLWTIPAGRMKARKEHRVPLSDRAMELLTRQKEYANGSPFVFTGYNGTSLDDTAMRKFLRDMGVPFTVHGFRTSFRNWAAEETDFDFYAVEMCIAHSVGNAVTRAYLRGDALKKRREIMQAWASYCGSNSYNS